MCLCGSLCIHGSRRRARSKGRERELVMKLASCEGTNLVQSGFGSMHSCFIFAQSRTVRQALPTIDGRGWSTTTTTTRTSVQPTHLTHPPFLTNVSHPPFLNHSSRARLRPLSLVRMQRGRCGAGAFGRGPFYTQRLQQPPPHPNNSHSVRARRHLESD